MSRNNNQELVNPASKYFEWDSTNIGFRYYDKQTDKKISISLPFKFLVLDCLSTIKGFNKAEDCGYWSNEVRDLSKETLIVRSKNGICAKGIYENVIKDRNCTGAKYCQSVYIGYYENKELVICNIQIIGSALGAWIEFRKKNKIFDGAVSVSTSVQETNGNNTYNVPVFKKVEVKPETDNAAKALDDKLQEFLSAYFKLKTQEIVETKNEEKIEAVAENVKEPAGRQSMQDKIEAAKKSKEEVAFDDDMPF